MPNVYIASHVGSYKDHIQFINIADNNDTVWAVSRKKSTLSNYSNNVLNLENIIEK